MENEEGEGMASADAGASWQQHYVWGNSYPLHHHHPQQQHTHHEHLQTAQYQQQLLPSQPGNAIHFPASQQHLLQLQTSQAPPLQQQTQYHPQYAQTTARRSAYNCGGSGTNLEKFISRKIRKMKMVLESFSDNFFYVSESNLSGN